MRWDDVTDVIITDIKWLRHSIPNYSSMILASSGTEPQQITIQGNTNSYQSLKKRLPELLPDSVRIRDLSYSLILSRVGVLYLLGIGSLTLFVILNQIVPHWMNMSLFGTRYSMIDFYPYFYLGLFLPPLWWWVVKPLHTFGIARLGKPRGYLWGVVGVAFSLAILRAMTGQWLLFPDIYPELTILILLASAIMGLWLPPLLTPHHQEAEDGSTKSWQRAPCRLMTQAFSLPKLLLTLLMLLIIFTSTSRLVKEITAYDNLLVAHQGLEQQNSLPSSQKSVRLFQSLEVYSKTLDINTNNLLALQGRAATFTLLKKFEAAEDDYKQLITDSSDSSAIYADRAITYQSWSLALAENNLSDSEKKLTQAVIYFSRAIARQSNKEERHKKDDYYLWRGITYQAAGKWEKALNDYEEIFSKEQTPLPLSFNQGLIYFEKANALIASGKGESSQVQASYKQALVSFQESGERSDPLIPLAIGYAHLGLQDDQAAQKSWQQAISLNATTSDERISRGTAYWSLGTLEGEPCPEPINQSSDAQKAAQNILYIQKAAKDFTRVIQLEANNSLAYRTLGQLHYLLRYCPSYDYQKEMRAAIASYQQAVKIDNQNAISWQYLARLQTAFYLAIYEQSERAEEALALLTQAAKNIDRAYQLEPNNSQSTLWRNDYIPSTALREGTRHYTLKNYELALAYFELTATYQADNPEAAFKAALSSLALGKGEEALNWYKEGIQRATDYNKSDTVQSALDDLNILIQNNPHLEPLAEPIRERLLRE
jgi:tetratricopeptide (TPR) repeat protein